MGQGPLEDERASPQEFPKFRVAIDGFIAAIGCSVDDFESIEHGIPPSGDRASRMPKPVVGMTQDFEGGLETCRKIITDCA